MSKIIKIDVLFYIYYMVRHAECAQCERTSQARLLSHDVTLCWNGRRLGQSSHTQFRHAPQTHVIAKNTAPWTGPFTPGSFRPTRMANFENEKKRAVSLHGKVRGDSDSPHLQLDHRLHPSLRHSLPHGYLPRSSAHCDVELNHLLVV